MSMEQNKTEDVVDKKNPQRPTDEMVSYVRRKQASDNSIERLDLMLCKVEAVMCSMPKNVPIPACIQDLKQIPIITQPVKNILAKVHSKAPKVKKGVLYAKPFDEKTVAIGFSLCDTRFDNFDVDPTTGLIEEGRGENIAKDRSRKWVERDKFFLKMEKCDNPPKVVAIPHSIKDDLGRFLNRFSRFYKDKALPQWAAGFMELYNKEMEEMQKKKEEAEQKKIA
jgi:hypothetical protein